MALNPYQPECKCAPYFLESSTHQWCEECGRLSKNVSLSPKYLDGFSKINKHKPRNLAVYTPASPIPIARL